MVQAEVHLYRHNGLARAALAAPSHEAPVGFLRCFLVLCLLYCSLSFLLCLVGVS